MTLLRTLRCDDETGEMITYEVNEETGESLVLAKVPSLFSDTLPKASLTDEPVLFPSGSVSKSKRFMTLKANIIAGANTTSPRMLLIITTLVVFSKLCCVFLMILEIYLHVKCHKKNNDLKASNLYFRSPFHVVTSIFCGLCRENYMASKIGQMQDKRHDRYDYLRGIAI